MHDIAIIGGGAAGMMAAISAAQNGKSVIIIEKNEKLGKKLFITGKGRCNITNACDTEDYCDHVIRNKKFMLSSVYTFPASEVMNFFESNGLKLKVERGERVFPASDKSSDVISCFAKILKKLDVDIALNTEVKNIDINSNMFLIFVFFFSSLKTNFSPYIFFCDDIRYFIR